MKDLSTMSRFSPAALQTNFTPNNSHTETSVYCLNFAVILLRLQNQKRLAPEHAQFAVSADIPLYFGFLF